MHGSHCMPFSCTVVNAWQSTHGSPSHWAHSLSREHRAPIFEFSLGLPAIRYSVVIVALPHFTFKFASLQAESSDPNAKRVAPSIGIAAGGPRIACRRTWHHEHAPNLSSCALQFARCTLLSWLEAQPTRMRAVEPIAISALVRL